MLRKGLPPDYADAEYADHARTIRKCLADRNFQQPRISLVQQTPASAADYASAAETGPFADLVFKPTMLVIYRIHYLAPWVSEPYFYEWEAALDEDGRGVTGPAYRRDLSGRQASLEDPNLIFDLFCPSCGAHIGYGSHFDWYGRIFAKHMRTQCPVNAGTWWHSR
jgi:hypothetical protein